MSIANLGSNTFKSLISLGRTSTEKAGIVQANAINVLNKSRKKTEEMITQLQSKLQFFLEKPDFFPRVKGKTKILNLNTLRNQPYENLLNIMGDQMDALMAVNDELISNYTTLTQEYDSLIRSLEYSSEAMGYKLNGELDPNLNDGDLEPEIYESEGEDQEVKFQKPQPITAVTNNSSTVQSTSMTQANQYQGL